MPRVRVSRILNQVRAATANTTVMHDELDVIVKAMRQQKPMPDALYPLAAAVRHLREARKCLTDAVTSLED